MRSLSLLVLFNLSCAQRYIEHDLEAFNEIIGERHELTPKELMELYYDKEMLDTQQMEVESLSDNCYQITLIRNQLGDDSIASIKSIMVATRTNKGWIASTIKENWKCYSGRGHQNWGISACN